MDKMTLIEYMKKYAVKVVDARVKKDSQQNKQVLLTPQRKQSLSPKQ